ncbi:MAG: PAAR domain-containing protein [Bacteroidota bacterium]
MPSAVRITDVTNYGGVILGPGVSTVLIGNLPAAVMGDNHAYGSAPIVTPTIVGSTTVLIGGKPALRVGDVCATGGSAVIGTPTVQIG